MEDQENHKSELSRLSVRDIFFKYIRFFPLFILSVVIAMLIAFLYLRYSTPIYSALGRILIKNEANRGGNDKFENLVMSGGTQNLQSELEILKSHPMMERVVKALNLEINYYSVGKIREPNIYKQGPFLMEILQLADSAQSFSLNIKFSGRNNFNVNNAEKKFSLGETFRNQHGIFRLKRNIGTPGKEYIVTWQPSYTAADLLAGSLVVVPKTQGTGILLISIQTPNAHMGADIVNELMVKYDAATIEDKNITVHQTLAFIDDRMGKLDKELDSIERNELNYREQFNVIDEEYQSSNYFNKFSEADKGIINQRNQLGASELVEGYLSDKRYEFERVPSSLGLEDPTLNGLINAYNQAQLERKILIDGNAPRGNVVVQQKEKKIEELRQSLLENVRNLKTAYNASLRSLQRQSNSVASQIRELPKKHRDLLEIQREKQSKAALYKFLQEKREETAISQASTISNSKIIDKAYPNTTPVKPNRRTVQLMALLIGIAVPGLFIFLLEILNDKVTTRYDIEKITQASILGEIGHSFTKETLFVTKINRSMVAEQFRSIRSNLQYVLNKIEKPVILVSSSFSGEGKSFVSINIGAVMALAGKKTVILEFDIRKPKILSGLGIAKKKGITNFLVGKASLDELPIPVSGFENLYAIGCGPTPPNPSELLLDVRVSDLFAYLKHNFDVIVIDTAPVGMVSDAMTLGKFADCTLYIVRQAYTFKKQIELLDEFYRESKLPKISIILNDVKLKSGYGYYGYGRYGYGKGYGTGYYEEETRPRRWYSKFMNGLDVKKKKGSQKV